MSMSSIRAVNILHWLAGRPPADVKAPTDEERVEACLLAIRALEIEGESLTCDADLLNIEEARERYLLELSAKAFSEASQEDEEC